MKWPNTGVQASKSSDSAPDTPDEIAAHPDSLTGEYLSGRRRIGPGAPRVPARLVKTLDGTGLAIYSARAGKALPVRIAGSSAASWVMVQRDGGIVRDANEALGALLGVPAAWVISSGAGYDYLNAFGLGSADITAGDLPTLSLEVRGII